MLTKVDVLNARGQTISLPLDDTSSGYSMEEIQGLGPVPGTLISTSFAQVDGEQYQSSRRESRFITIQLGLSPNFAANQTVDSLRSTLYTYFMTKSAVTLTFTKSNGLVVSIEGRVEKCEPDIFSKDPAINVTIKCFNPDFYNPTPINIAGMTTQFSDEIIVSYSGSVESPIRLVMNIDRSLSDFTFYHRPPDGTSRQMDVTYPFIAGDTLTLSTARGGKEVTLTRAGVDTSILYSFSPYSNWIEFQPGENHIRLYAEGAGIPFTISYTDKYGGL